MLLWQIAAWLAADSRLLPAPASVFEVQVEQTASGDLLHHLGVTLARVAASFVIAMTVGGAIGIAMGRSPVVDRLGQPWLVLFLHIPALVVIVLAYIWIGLAEAALITAVAVNKIPNTVVTLREGVRALDRSLLEMAEVFRLGRAKTLRQVILPHLYPTLPRPGAPGSR